MENWWLGWVFVLISMGKCYQILRDPQIPWIHALPLTFSFESLGFAMMVSMPWLRTVAIVSVFVWFAWAWATSHFYLFISEKGD